METLSEHPPWAREEAFDLKPDQIDGKEAPYGWRSEKGKEVVFDSFEEFEEAVRSGRGKLAFVWTPDHERLVAPEEVPDLLDALVERSRVHAEGDLEGLRKTLWVFGFLFAWAVAFAFQSGGWQGVLRSQNVGLITLIGLFFALIPWWQARSALGARKATVSGLTSEIPEARFDLWLNGQKVRALWFLAAIVMVVGLVQLLVGGGFAAAQLHKESPEWWRLFTGPLLHKNPLHFIMNAMGLWYLARRVEVLAGWPHSLTVFQFSLIGGSWATLTFVPNYPSVGISGAVCGLLGFLLVFEWLHAKLAPRSARVRLLGMLTLLAVVGVIGFNFIDNAAHLGGLFTGAVYAAIVFPKTKSHKRPRILKQDQWMGGVGAVIIAGSAIWAIFQMITNK